MLQKLRSSKRRIQSLLLTILLCFFTAFSSFATPITNSSTNNVNLHLSNSNYQTAVNDSSIPKEVRDAINEIYQKHPNASVSISNTDMPTTRGSSSAWGSYRTYKNHKIRDWIITTTASYPSTLIKKDSNAAYFAEQGVWTIAGAVASKFPILGNAVSIIQALAGMPTNPSPSGSDFLEAAPTYTCKEKFTYVYVGDQYFLGTKSYCSTINSIFWRLYLADTHKTYTKTINCNSVYKTSCYDSPDDKAIVYFGNGGYMEDRPSIKIGPITFDLT